MTFSQSWLKIALEIFSSLNIKRTLKLEKLKFFHDQNIPSSSLSVSISSSLKSLFFGWIFNHFFITIDGQNAYKKTHPSNIKTKERKNKIKWRKAIKFSRNVPQIVSLFEHAYFQRIIKIPEEKMWTLRNRWMWSLFKWIHGSRSHVYINNWSNTETHKTQLARKINILDLTTKTYMKHHNLFK